MNLLRPINRKWVYNTLSFSIPFVAVLMVMLFGGCSPFGKYSMLYSDMFHQYYPFFKTFRSMILSGESLLYNWNIGLGVDFLGLYAYYLASPLNFLSLLVPEPWLLGYFSLLVPIKLGLASLFFGIFLQKTFDKCDLSIPLFSCFYGLCAWALGYQWNVMWLDTFALLPLVILGMVSLFEKKKFVLYTLTLFLSVAINYYIGLFTCIFVLLCFICYQICRFSTVKKFFQDLCRIAIFSILAIVMTAFISLPTLASLQNTQSSVNTFPQGFQLNMTTEDNWLGLFKTMFTVAGNVNGGIEPTFKEGLPNIYCGIFTTILAFLYLLCGKIRVRDRLCCLFLLIFLNISFIVRQLDYIWHGFHFTNMIPYRFSFLYSFVMLYMAYAAWVKRRDIKWWQVLIALAASAGLVFCSDNRNSELYLLYNSAGIVCYIAILLLHTIKLKSKKENKKKNIQKKEKIEVDDSTEVWSPRINFPAKQSLCSILLLAVIVVEMVMNVVNFGMRFPLTNASNYPKGTTASADVLEHMEELEKDNLFYRTEVTHSQTLNDGALNGYYGISAFTSSANVRVTEFMKALGYGAKNTYNRYCFEESSPVANLFLGLKYMVERDGSVEENPYFDTVYNNDTIYLLENNAYLPLGFLANSQLLNVDFSNSDNRFGFQNELIKQATGLSDNVWYILPGTTLTITGNCQTVTPQPSTGYCTYTTKESTGLITYTYTANREGLLCVNLDLTKRNNFSLWLNDKKLYSETYSLPQMLSVCNVKPGDVVEVRLDCKKNESGTIKLQAAILDEEFFREAHTTLATHTLKLTDFQTTRLEGTIYADREGVLYTSIPQNGNWHAYVDNKEVETVLIGDAMIGIILTEGNHTVRFEYRNDAFSLGLKITLVCLLLFFSIYWVEYKPGANLYKGKFLHKY